MRLAKTKGEGTSGKRSKLFIVVIFTAYGIGKNEAGFENLFHIKVYQIQRFNFCVLVKKQKEKCFQNII